jgi:creatinine amidohydrolase
LRTFSLFGSPGVNFDTVSKQERTYGFHAGEIETAFLLYGTPELVHTDQYTSNYIARVDKPELLKPEGSSANFAWLTRDIAPSGVMGDPANATAENGERWVNEAAVKIAEILTAMYHFVPRHDA